MNHGVIEQVGTPLEIYRRPVSPFVADFIGVMNFVPGTVLAAHAVRVGAVQLSADVAGLAPGTEVTVAIRPEEIQVLGAHREETNAFDARVEAMTFVGSFFRIDLASDRIGPSRLRADLAVDAMSQLEATEGRTLTVVLPPGRLRVYPRHGLPA